MSMPKPAGEGPEGHWIEAVEWHARRCESRPLTAAQERAWSTWQQDPENRAIYAACARLYAQALQLNGAALPIRPLPSIADPQPHRASAGAGRRIGMLTGGLLAALCASMLLWPEVSRTPGMGRRGSSVPAVGYVTHAAQTRSVRLPDGSTMILGADTALSVALGPHHRTVVLKRGEAWFRVAHQDAWPFRVRAGDGIITDVGTAFVVDRDTRRIEVTVTEGRVEITLEPRRRAAFAHAPPLKPVRLHRGERYTYGPEAAQIVRSVDPRLAIAWTHGELEFTDEPLRDVIENLNRYTSRPITVSQAAGGLRLTTLIRVHEIPAWLNALSHVLPVTVRNRDVSVCIRIRAHLEHGKNNACMTR